MALYISAIDVSQTGRIHLEYVDVGSLGCIWLSTEKRCQ